MCFLLLLPRVRGISYLVAWSNLDCYLSTRSNGLLPQQCHLIHTVVDRYYEMAKDICSKYCMLIEGISP